MYLERDLTKHRSSMQDQKKIKLYIKGFPEHMFLETCGSYIVVNIF